MKVLHVYAGNLFGGIETLLLTLARERHLCPEMEAQFALCFEGRLSEQLASTGVKVHQLGAVRLRDLTSVLRARASLEQIIRQNDIDLVICHACWPQVIFGGTVKKLNKPLIFWCHDILTGTNLLERFAKFVRPDLVIANSEYTQQHLDRVYPNISDRVVYCPVSPIQVEQPSLVRQQVRQQLETAADATVIIQVSRMERWKGHSLSIAALGEIKDLDNWEYWIVGGIQRESERDYFAALQQQVIQLGLESRIRFLGERRDVPDLLTAADIFCQPNLNPEPFGIAFIEALYVGLPIVTVAIGGGGEIVTSDCGYAVEPGNTRQVAEALRSLIEQPTKRQYFSTAAIDRAIELSNPKQQLEKIDRLARELCQSKSSESHLISIHK
jgi:glycosyltransferase involved in cell wall biosynthesis